MISDMKAVNITFSGPEFLELVQFFRKNELVLTPVLTDLYRNFERRMYEFLTIDEAEEFFK